MQTSEKLQGFVLFLPTIGGQDAVDVLLDGIVFPHTLFQSCIGFIGCESDQNTDRTAHSAAFTDWMRNMQLLMIIQGNFLIVQMCS